jgi:1,4-dihydroxy-2-naphthoyl-CoA hydrolase
VLRGTGDRTTHVSLGESGQLWARKLELPQAGGKTHLIFCYDYVMQDPADAQPGPDSDVHFSAEAASRFLAAAGLVVDSADGTRVTGHIDFGPDHHTPWGVVQGGVYTTAVESAAGLGASLAVQDRGQFAVGVHNATDFLRPATSGRAEVIAEPLQQGRVQQLWLVTITGEGGQALARGQLRLQNVPLPGTGTN